MDGVEPTALAVMATSRPVRVVVSVLVVAVLSLALIATLLGAGLVHAHVTTGEKVATLESIQRELANVSSDDHDRLTRIEAQVEYLAKLTLMQINDQRVAAGKEPMPDEFPRDSAKDGE